MGKSKWFCWNERSYIYICNNSRFFFTCVCGFWPIVTLMILEFLEGSSLKYLKKKIVTQSQAAAGPRAASRAFHTYRFKSWDSNRLQFIANGSWHCSLYANVLWGNASNNRQESITLVWLIQKTRITSRNRTVILISLYKRSQAKQSWCSAPAWGPGWWWSLGRKDSTVSTGGSHTGWWGGCCWVLHVQ